MKRFKQDHYSKDYFSMAAFVFLFLLTDFDLEKEKSVLDEQGLRIAENQENSQKNRRKLAESTRGIPFYLYHDHSVSSH